MNELANDPQQDDDAFVAQLEDIDDGLASGRTPPEAVSNRLRRGLAALQALRQIKPEREEAPTVTNQRALTPGGPVGGETPQRLGRFHLIREIGRGGFGIVFLAHDPKLHRHVALKVPRMPGLLDAQLHERFRREARAAAGLNHPNIVSVYEVDETGPVTAIVSAYCPGVTLAEWLAKQKAAVPPTDAARLVAVLADAVEHAHQNGVLHRDLKPANIIVNAAPSRKVGDASTLLETGNSRGEGPLESQADPQLPSVRITDFGLAKLADDPVGMTQTGAILGTPAYMAPEQARGKAATLDGRADVYALGAMLYELLTGRPPFRGESDVDTLQQVATAEPIAPRQLRPKLPRDLETICLKCLQKEPARRYANAADLRDDLQRFIDRKPVVARPVGRVMRTARWCRRHKLVSALSVAVVVVTAIGAALATKEYMRANTERAAAVTARERSDRLLGSAHQVLGRLHTMGTTLITNSKTVQYGNDILRESLEYHRKLLAESVDDPSLRHDAARANFLVAEILKSQGQFVDAEKHCRQALAVFEELLVDSPDDIELLRQRAVCCVGMGTAAWEQHRHTDAHEWYERAEREHHAIAERRESTVEDRRLELTALMYHGTVDVRNLDRERGMRSLAKAVEALMELNRDHPEDAAVKRTFAAGLERLSSSAATDDKDLAVAEKHVRSSIDLFRQVWKDRPRSSAAQFGVAKGLARLAVILRKTNRPAEAKEAADESTATYANLIDGTPSNAEILFEFAKHLANVGNWRKSDGDRAGGVASYRHAIDVYEKLVKLQNSRPRWKIDLGGLHLVVANNTLALNDLESARTHADKARALIEETTPPLPEHAEVHKTMVEGLKKIDQQLAEKKPAKSDDKLR